MRFILPIIGIVLCFICIKYRQSIANSIGYYDWMRYVGGPESFIAIIGMLFFFWSIAAATGTQEIFLAPILWLIPGGNNGTPPPTNSLY